MKDTQINNMHMCTNITRQIYPELYIYFINLKFNNLNDKKYLNIFYFSRC